MGKIVTNCSLGGSTKAYAFWGCEDMAILIQVRVSEDGSLEAFEGPVRTAVETLRKELPEEFAQLGRDLATVLYL